MKKLKNIGHTIAKVSLLSISVVIFGIVFFELYLAYLNASGQKEKSEQITNQNPRNRAGKGHQEKKELS